MPDKNVQKGMLAHVPIDVIRENYDHISAVLKKESAAYGRPPRMIAVTKTVDAQTALSLHALGVTDIAENRVQMLRDKLPLLKENKVNFNLHLIGQLQSNKVKYIIDEVCLVHSLDKLSLAQEIDRLASKRGKPLPVLVQINISGEESKGGVSPTEAEAFIRACAAYQGAAIKGLMTMMPKDAPREQLYAWFTQARALFEALRDEAIQNVSMNELSMGMSRDYDLAARAGATMVRIGSALFQKRP